MATLAAPTIEELIVEIRAFLNQPKAENSFWSDEELTAYLNEGLNRSYFEIVQDFQGQFMTYADLDITSGSETIALPSDFFEAKTLLRKVNNGYEPLFYRNEINEGYLTQNGGTGTMYMPTYQFRGNNLVLHPVPNFSETAGLRLEYLQLPSILQGGGDTLTSQISPVFRDVIKMYAVWKAKVKESLVSGADTSALALQNLNDLFTALKEVVRSRSASQLAIVPFNPEEY